MDYTRLQMDYLRIQMDYHFGLSSGQVDDQTCFAPGESKLTGLQFLSFKLNDRQEKRENCDCFINLWCNFEGFN